MKFTRSRKFDFPPKFPIGGSDILEVRTELKILGVMVQSDMGCSVSGDGAPGHQHHMGNQKDENSRGQ